MNILFLVHFISLCYYLCIKKCIKTFMINLTTFYKTWIKCTKEKIWNNVQKNKYEIMRNMYLIFSFVEKYSSLQLCWLWSKLSNTTTGASTSKTILNLRLRWLPSYNDNYFCMWHLSFPPVSNVFQPQEAYR